MWIFGDDDKPWAGQKRTPGEGSGRQKEVPGKEGLNYLSCPAPAALVEGTEGHSSSLSDAWLGLVGSQYGAVSSLPGESSLALLAMFPFLGLEPSCVPHNCGIPLLDLRVFFHF